MVGTQDVSESRGDPGGPPVNVDYLTRFARAHEEAGFDRVLVGYHATGPESFAVAHHVLSATSTLKVLIAHRPGFVAPTLVARELATLDLLTGGGRVAIHHITGGDEADQRRDGDFAGHDERYRRTAEFMDVLRRELTSSEPFGYDGEFYRVEGAFSHVKPAAPVPLYFGGASAPAVAAGARHADVYMLWGEPLEQVRERITVIRRQGGQLRPHGPVQPVRPADRRRHRSRGVAASRADTAGDRRPCRAGRRERRPAGAGRARARRPGRPGQAAEGWRVTRALFRSFVCRVGPAAGAGARARGPRRAPVVRRHGLTGPGGNSSALVGTPEQVAQALMRYREAGVDTILIRGFDPLEDVVDWGRELIPRIRDLAETIPVGGRRR